MPGQYADAWESFWRDAPKEAGTVFWDAAPERTAGRHLPLFGPHFGGRPVVDLGCGNGTQTRFLARRYPRVVGVDLSEAAIGRARETVAAPPGPAAAAPGAATPAVTGPGPEVPDRPEQANHAPDFRALDAADPGAVRALREELGECDVYLRGVLHQCPPHDRPRIAASVATLVGERGRAFVVEPAEAGGATLASLMGRPGGPPPSLAAVFAHGIRPMEMPDASVPEFFREAGLEVLDDGTAPLALTVAGEDGTPLDLPSTWLVAGRADG